MISRERRKHRVLLFMYRAEKLAIADTFYLATDSYG